MQTSGLKVLQTDPKVDFLCLFPAFFQVLFFPFMTDKNFHLLVKLCVALSAKTQKPFPRDQGRYHGHLFTTALFSLEALGKNTLIIQVNVKNTV